MPSIAHDVEIPDGPVVQGGFGFAVAGEAGYRETRRQYIELSSLLSQRYASAFK
jgi:hypothetical protein